MSPKLRSCWYSYNLTKELPCRVFLFSFFFFFRFWTFIFLIINPKLKIYLVEQNMLDFDYLDLRSLIKNTYFLQAQSMLTSGQTWKPQKMPLLSCRWFEIKVESFWLTGLQRKRSNKGCPSVDSCKMENFKNEDKYLKVSWAIKWCFR